MQTTDFLYWSWVRQTGWTGLIYFNIHLCKTPQKTYSHFQKWLWQLHTSRFMKAHSRLRSVAQVTLGNKVPESTRQASKVLLPHSVLCFFSSTTTTPVTVLCYYSIQQELETGLPVQDWDLVSNVSPFFTIPSYLLLTIGSGPRSTFPISHAVAFPRDSPLGWLCCRHG